jgi:hypothetical protein
MIGIFSTAERSAQVWPGVSHGGAQLRPQACAVQSHHKFPSAARVVVAAVPGPSLLSLGGGGSFLFESAYDV